MTTMFTFFSSIRDVLTPLQNSFETGKKTRSETGAFGNHKEITALSNVQALELGPWSPLAFLDLNFVGGLNLLIIECWIWYFYGMHFPKQDLYLQFHLGKMVAHHCTLPHTTLDAPCPSPVGVTAPTSIERRRDGCI